jgi:Flp pilus assembly protein TadD
MDVDYANDKGSYVIAPFDETTVMSRDRIITWSDYRREDGDRTFGLLSQVSPDGRYVISTVKDRSIFMAKDDLAFSQLFFPIKGILVVYDRQTKQFAPLPGANDPAFCQSNPSWSPDGQTVLFSRAPARDLKNLKHPEQALITEAEAEGFFRENPRYVYDVFRVPFNGGKGGTAEPVAGASGNGKSNFFARYSPDGRWIVFCQARSFMLLQPDTELFVIPSAGGEARRLACNTPRMNSWHTFTPDGKWLAFATKAWGPFTRVALARFYPDGTTSPAVTLFHMTSADRAANIPEFVNAAPDAIRRIQEKFMDDISFIRAGTDLFNGGNVARAEEMFRRAVSFNPTNDVARFCLGNTLASQGRLVDALAAFAAAERIVPRDLYACRQGQVLRELNRLAEAQTALERAVSLNPRHAEAQSELGKTRFALGRVKEAVEPLRAAANLETEDPSHRYSLALALWRTGDQAGAEREIEVARQLAQKSGDTVQLAQIEALQAMIRGRR